MVAVAAYHGPPAPGLGNALTSWTPDPAAIVAVVALAGLYLLGVTRARRHGHRWPVLATAAFCGPGLVSLLVATAGWVGRYAHVLFWARTLQVTLLLIVTPVFLAFGRPLTLAALALPPAAARRLTAATGGRLSKTLLNPMLGPLLVPVACVAVFFTGIWELTLRHYAGYEIGNLALLAVGLLIALPLAGEGIELGSASIALAILVGFFELLADALPGIVLRLRTDLIAPGYYLGVHRPWGPGPLSDQRTGGGILWLVGEVIDLPFLAILVTRWIRADEREAARIDRALDGRVAAVPGQASGGQPTDRATRDPAGRRAPGLDEDISTAALDQMLEPDREVPWWEIDASVFGDRRGAAYQRRRRGDGGA